MKPCGDGARNTLKVKRNHRCQRRRPDWHPVCHCEGGLPTAAIDEERSITTACPEARRRVASLLVMTILGEFIVSSIIEALGLGLPFRDDSQAHSPPITEIAGQRPRATSDRLWLSGSRMAVGRAAMISIAE